MNPFVKQKLMHRQIKQIYGYQRGEEGGETRNLRLRDTHTTIKKKKISNEFYCIVQGIIFHIL